MRKPGHLAKSLIFLKIYLNNLWLTQYYNLTITPAAAMLRDKRISERRGFVVTFKNYYMQ